MNPNTFYSEIQDEICSLYDEANKNRPLIYKKDKINIAIHIRVFNEMDFKEDFNYHEEYSNNYSARCVLNCNFYIKLIEMFMNKYRNLEIHIFSQEKYFDIRFSNLRKIPFLNFQHFTIYVIQIYLC